LPAHHAGGAPLTRSPRPAGSRGPAHASRVPFTARTSWNLSENVLTRSVAEARAAGRSLADLTESNPTRCGLDETPSRSLLALLAHPRARRYEPLPHGHPEARAAVARYYAERGLSVSADRITLSASTSEAYGWLFKLLAERGDEVLVPAPSYPLLSFLARLEDVRLVPYPLAREQGFQIDLDALVSAIDDRTRAILLVHPNNPTGSLVRRDEADALDALCARHGIALIVDEVFGDYTHGDPPADRLPSFVGPRQALTFVLSGLSKVVALPQLKLGWIATLGEGDVVAEATRRLEVIADTYLSVGTPVQLALPEILAARAPIQAALRARVAGNLAALDAALVGRETRRLPCDAGWYAILEIPRRGEPAARTEDDWADLLVRDEGVIVHPGYFFDMDRDGFLVVSLLPEPDVFAAAIRRVVARLEAG
jgi:alanine-synthesizing transaminase